MNDLAPFAMPDEATRGRRHPEPAHPFRLPYQRDRERIVHSSAFRRMTGKTQVLPASVNDHHRTRLTHTLEVVQVARTVARRLKLNEDLTEAIALAHDIGHPPFGHAGETVLDECLANAGGFNHNLYGLRRVDELEARYPDFPGLNLTFEVRESFVRHAGKLADPKFAEFAAAGAELLEALVVDLVDSIAYDTHDVDDALGLGFITLIDLEELGLWRRAATPVRRAYPALDGYSLRTAVVRELLALQVDDLLGETTRRLDAARIRTVSDVRGASVPLVGLSETIAKEKGELERFLRERVYTHYRVLRMTASGKRMIHALFGTYLASPELLPVRHGRRLRETTSQPEVVVGDYLAGMTDRFAIQEYRRLHAAPSEV